MAFPGYGGNPGQPQYGQYGGAPPPGAAPPPQGFPGQGYAAQQQGFPGQAPPQLGYNPAQYGQQPGYGAQMPGAPPQGPLGGPAGMPPGPQAPPGAGAAGMPPGPPGAGAAGMPPGPTAAAAPGMNSELYSWFVAVDQDDTGQIDAKELRQALTHANWSTFDEATCRYMIGMFDHDKSGTIDVNEFAQLWNYIQQWKRVFEGFDRDRSGGIDANELHTALNQMGYRLSPTFCQLVVNKYDTVNHKELRLDSYIQVCALMGSLTDAFRRRDTQMSGMISIGYEDFMTVIFSSRP